MEGFCIISSSHISTLKKDSERLFSGLDVTVKCSDGEVEVKRNILAYCSHPLRKMFQAFPLSQPLCLSVLEFEYQDMTAVVRFMYTGATSVQCGRLENFTKVATYLKIRGLESPYEDSIPGNVLIDEALSNGDAKSLVVDLQSCTAVPTTQEVSLQSNEQLIEFAPQATTSKSTPKADSSSVPTLSASSCSIKQEQQDLEDSHLYNTTLPPIISSPYPMHGICGVCHKSIPKHAMKRHYETHKEVRQLFSCSSCSKSYLLRRLLMNHERICPAKNRLLNDKKICLQQKFFTKVS